MAEGHPDPPPGAWGKNLAEVTMDLVRDKRSRKVLMRAAADKRTATKAPITSHDATSKALVDAAVRKGYENQPLTRHAAINFLDLHVRSLRQQVELEGNAFDLQSLPEDVRNVLEGKGTYTTKQIMQMTRNLHERLAFDMRDLFRTKVRTVLRTAARINRL